MADPTLALVAQVKAFIEEKYRTTNKPISYLHVILDPNSFSRTVENIYLVSVLANDGLIAIRSGEDVELPFITPVDPNSQEASAEDEEAGGGGSVISINKKRWRDLLTAFEITEPMMVLNRQ